MRLKLGAFVALAVIAADLASKWYIVTVIMNPPRIHEVLPFFNLVLGFNRGISFGLFNSDSPEAPYVLSALALGVTAMLIVWLWKAASRNEALALGAIIGGALANVADRLRDGAVTDFLDLHFRSFHWPTFNFADIAISMGVVLLIVLSWQRDRHPVRANG